MKASFIPYHLQFKRAAKTSRNTLVNKPTWYILLEHEEKRGIGEVGIIKGLSVDDLDDLEDKIKDVCERIEYYLEKPHELDEFPSIKFALETALMHLWAKQDFKLFENDFSQKEKPIKINGLIWMGDAAFMKSQLRERLDLGFDCIKMKIGAIDFETELNLLKSIRQEFSADQVELRVDANGAFAADEALEKLNRLSEFNLHSIEQPIAANQWEAMRTLCEETPIPIALDEELIDRNEMDIDILLDSISPQYIILKPGLHGGFGLSDQWIAAAEEKGIGWWATSALESNIGLNAIAQWAGSKELKMPQGLGTGSLFTNNIPSPLRLSRDQLRYDLKEKWDLSIFNG
ncbi:MAG: o-succinylbenzoate synthase [Bacteroidota bacterium]